MEHWFSILALADAMQAQNFDTSCIHIIKIALKKGSKDFFGVFLFFLHFPLSHPLQNLQKTVGKFVQIINIILAHYISKKENFALHE